MKDTEVSYAHDMALLCKLVNIHGLHEQLGPPVRTLRSLYHAKKIPAIKTGHRTLLFDPVKVRAALDKFEVKAATARK